MQVKKRKPRKFDAKSAKLTSKFSMNYDSSFSDIELEANLDAFSVRAKVVVSKGDQNTGRVTRYGERKRVAVTQSVGSAEDHYANARHELDGRRCKIPAKV